jgi:hypothetical protein
MESIGSLVKYNNTHADAQRVISRSKNKSSGDLCRFINVLFHQDFRDHFLKINNIKTRTDHEGLEGAGWLPKEFWSRVADVITYSEPDGEDSIETQLRTVWMPMDDSKQEIFDHLTSLFYGDETIELNGSTTNYRADWFKKKHGELDRVRKKIDFYLHKSGNGDPDPWSKVDLALAEAPGIRKPEAYYYYVRANEFKIEIEKAFGSSLDNSLRGNGSEGDVESPDDHSKGSRSAPKEYFKQLIDSHNENSVKQEAFMASLSANFSDISKSESQKAQAEMKKAKTAGFLCFNNLMKDFYAATHIDYKRQLVAMMQDTKESYNLNVVVPVVEAE